MVNKKFTLLELHLDEGSIQIGPAALGGEDEEITEPESKDSDESDDDDGGRCPGRKLGKLLVVLVVVLLLALGLKKVLGGGYEDLDELEELSELDEE